MTQDAQSDPLAGPPEEARSSSPASPDWWAYVLRCAERITKADSFQVVRRERGNGQIHYRVIAWTGREATEIASVEGSRHDAEFISACFAQAPLLKQVGASPSVAAADARQHQAEIETLTQERDRALSRREHTEAWYAVRLQLLEDWFRGPGKDLQIAAQFWNIIANGSTDVHTPNTYAGLLNQAKHRAEAAIAEKDAEINRLRISLRMVLGTSYERSRTPRSR
jgi:hypothetical protein